MEFFGNKMLSKPKVVVSKDGYVNIQYRTPWNLNYAYKKSVYKYMHRLGTAKARATKYYGVDQRDDGQFYGSKLDNAKPIYFNEHLNYQDEREFLDQ